MFCNNKTMRIFMKNIFALTLLTMLMGCASITKSNDQKISIQTMEMGTPVDNVVCVVNNEKGSWTVNSPGSITIQKAFGDLTVKCSKGESEGIATFKSKADSEIIGSWAMGGYIGYSIDKSNGSGFSYPELIMVNIKSKGE